MAETRAAMGLIGGGTMLGRPRDDRAPAWLGALPRSGSPDSVQPAAGRERTGPASAPARVRPADSKASRRLIEAQKQPMMLLDRRGLVNRGQCAGQLLYPALRAQSPLSFGIRNPACWRPLRSAERAGAGRIRTARTGAHRAKLRGSGRAAARRPARGRSLPHLHHGTRRPISDARSRCGSISLPMPAMNCAHRSRPSWVLSKPCRGGRAMTRRCADRFLGIMSQQGKRMAG